MKEIHTVLGAGPVAKATVDVLLSLGLNVRVVHRSGTFPRQPGVEVVASDTSNLAQLTLAFKDSIVVYMCAMPAYHLWGREFDAMMTNVLKACVDTGSNMVFADNLYMYLDSPHAPLTENSPLKPTTRKGVVRARIATMVMQVNGNGKIKTAIARASDFYGPHVSNAMLGSRFFPQLIAGKTLQWIGNPDMPHSYTYVPDFAQALVELGVGGTGWGEVWHVPNAPQRTAREVAALAIPYENPAKFSSIGKKTLRLLGVFNPAAKEMIEMLPHSEQPYLVDDSKWRNCMKTRATPWEQGLAATVASYKH